MIQKRDGAGFFFLLYPNLAVEMKAVDKAEETNDQSTCC